MLTVDLHLAGVWSSHSGFGPVLTCWWTMVTREICWDLPSIWCIFFALRHPCESGPLLPAVAGGMQPESKEGYNNKNNKPLSISWSDKTYKTQGTSLVKVQFLTLTVSSRTKV